MEGEGDTFLFGRDERRGLYLHILQGRRERVIPPYLAGMEGEGDPSLFGRDGGKGGDIKKSINKFETLKFFSIRKNIILKKF